MSISDLILILLCLFASSYLWTRQEQKDAYLVVYKDDQIFGEYLLSEDIQLVIDEHNSIEIKDGKARISYSDCPDKRCVKQGFNNNMPIICLPNRLVLEFRRKDGDHRLILQ
nr:hypothetical protein [Candidatus Cloacimonadota bacterium]